MADVIPNSGLDEWRDWEDPMVLILLTDGLVTPDRTKVFVSEVAPTYEVTVSGYTRWVVVNPERFVNDSLNRVEYKFDPADLPDFGVPVAGETVQWVMGALNTGNDATAVITGYWELPATATAGVPFLPFPGGSSIAHILNQKP